jgi:hypothetical protein
VEEKLILDNNNIYITPNSTADTSISVSRGSGSEAALIRHKAISDKDNYLKINEL